MQGYTYSVFSAVAIAIHLIINYRLLLGRGIETARGRRYRGFLLGVLFYYATDAARGLFAGLGWMRFLYADTIFFFLGLVAFVVLWCRFVLVYLGFGKWPSRILSGCGFALLAFNVAMLAANFFDGRVFSIDAQGTCVTGPVRDQAIALLVAFNVLTALFVLAKAMNSRDAVRRRGMMVLMFGITVTTSIVLQIVWPLTPFTSLGCLISNCFFHVFVVQDEMAAKHAEELERALDRARAAAKEGRPHNLVFSDFWMPRMNGPEFAEKLRAGPRVISAAKGATRETPGPPPASSASPSASSGRPARRRVRLVGERRSLRDTRFRRNAFAPSTPAARATARKAFRGRENPVGTMRESVAP